MFPSGQLLHVLIVIFLAGIPSLFSLNFRYTYLRLTRYNIGGTMSLQKPAIFLYVPPTTQLAADRNTKAGSKVYHCHLIHINP